MYHSPPPTHATIKPLSPKAGNGDADLLSQLWEMETGGWQNSLWPVLDREIPLKNKSFLKEILWERDETEIDRQAQRDRQRFLRISVLSEDGLYQWHQFRLGLASRKTCPSLPFTISSVKGHRVESWQCPETQASSSTLLVSAPPLPGHFPCRLPQSPVQRWLLSTSLSPGLPCYCFLVSVKSVWDCVLALTRSPWKVKLSTVPISIFPSTSKTEAGDRSEPRS